MNPAAIDPPLVTTPKLERFLASNALPTPYVVVDVDEIERRYRELRSALPVAQVYYAVKANPGTADELDTFITAARGARLCCSPQTCRRDLVGRAARSRQIDAQS